ncbi:ABC transporter permease [Alteromonas sp. 5E99-2]|uniref:ABC transporter permease n=1 Tax=Alteromonas sp. 5E99-2 TaxID=2817683 RepID=UPI001A99B214|nr:ABC transporter permease [Alteromonas sp. 5E99-2]MBO1254151.1 ABC transporter permease [Alteromonas sp. 5E99-2]
MSAITKRSPVKIWLDVIFALFVREIRIGFNDRLGLSWAIVQPVLFILVLSTLRGKLDGGSTHGIPTFLFMSYGLVLMQLFLQTFSAASNSIKRAKPLFAFRQVQPISAVVASGIFELFVKLVVAFCLYMFIYFIDMDFEMKDPLFAITIFIEIWFLSLSLGLIFGVANLFVPEIKKLETMLTRPLFFISGVFFSLQDIPKEYWYLLDWNPILHGIELIRFASYDSYGKVGVSSYYLFICVLVSVFFSLLIYQRFWKQAVSQ